MRYALAAALLPVPLVVACSTGGGPPDGTGSSAATAEEPGGGEATLFEISETPSRVTMASEAMVVEVGFDPFVLTASDPGGEAFFRQQEIGIRRGEGAASIKEVTRAEPGMDHLTLYVSFSDGSDGVLEIGAETGRTIAVRVSPADPGGVSAWGATAALRAGELIYGLTERIVDDPIASEIVPAEVGSLDRRGEMVSMYVTPTMSGYVPFHQSSAGYGLLVDGYMPGRYDVGATDADELRLEFELDPHQLAGTYHLIYGPDHATILDEYYGLTGQPWVPPDHAFLHWRGRDELPVGDPVEVEGVRMNASVASDLGAYERYGIPAGVYHFDRPWAMGQEGFGELVFDGERFPDAAGMLALMEERGWRNMVWVSPWAIGQRGEHARASGYLAPGSERAIDLTNPEAVAWLQQDLGEFLSGPEGSHIDGFFMDRGDEGDVSSTAADVYFDGRNGRQIHNWYPVEYARVFSEVMQAARPGEGLLIARPGYTGSQAYTMRWGGDTHSREGLAVPELPVESAPSTDLGLRSVLISVQRAAFMGTPFWGSDIGGYTAWVDREVYARWIEVGFASPLMRFHGQGGTPWETTTGGLDEELLDIYRRYVVLRHEMNGYLSDAAAQAASTGMPMARPLVFAWPDEPGALDRWDEWMLGDDLLVAPVWRSRARSREVWIPPGEWVDFWDRGSVVEGPASIEIEVPLDVLPMWVRPGSPLLELEVP